MSGLADILERIISRLTQLERRVENSMRHGTVAEVDAAKGMVRLKIGGTESEPLLSPWIHYGQTAGALKVHAPPSAGQQMTLFSPSGDFAQGVAMPMTWSDANASPSTSATENVMTFGNLRVEARGDELVITVPKVKLVAGGSTFELTGAGLQLAANTIAMTGSSLNHNGKNVGHNHKHGGVLPGGAQTAEPV